MVPGGGRPDAGCRQPEETTGPDGGQPGTTSHPGRAATCRSPTELAGGHSPSAAGRCVYSSAEEGRWRRNRGPVLEAWHGDPAGWRSGDERAARDSQRGDRRRRAGSRPSRWRGAHAEPGNVTPCRARRSRRRCRARQHDLATGRRGDRRGKSRRSGAGRQRSAGSSLWRSRDRSGGGAGSATVDTGSARLPAGRVGRPCGGDGSSRKLAARECVTSSRTDRSRPMRAGTSCPRTSAQGARPSPRRDGAVEMRGERRAAPSPRPDAAPRRAASGPVLRGERIGEEDQVGEVQGEVHQDA